MATKEKKFRTQFNGNYQGTPQQKNWGDHQTRPDMTIPLEQMLINHTRGLGGLQFREGIYTDDVEAPWYTDILELKEHKEELVRKQKEIEAEIKDAVAKKKADDLKKAQEAARAAKKEEEEQTPTQEEKPA